MCFSHIFTVLLLVMRFV